MTPLPERLLDGEGMGALRAPRSVPTAPGPRPAALSYTVKDAALVIGVSHRTLWRFIAAGEIATFKLGCRTLIRADVLRDLIDRHSQAA